MLAPNDYVEQVRRTLRTTIPSGRGSETVIAELMSLPIRTLRWQLAAQGTNFRKLMEEVRYEIARELLLDTDMNIADIAESLDYADASAFTRAFRRWTDASPAAWRAKFRFAEGKLRMAERAWKG
jgi:AraC-like DNA-binding protein